MPSCAWRASAPHAAARTAPTQRDRAKERGARVAKEQVLRGVRGLELSFGEGPASEQPEDRHAPQPPDAHENHPQPTERGGSPRRVRARRRMPGLFLRQAHGAMDVDALALSYSNAIDPV
jgi:hypothetical protein